MPDTPMSLTELREACDDNSYSGKAPGMKTRTLHHERMLNLAAMKEVLNNHGGNGPMLAAEKRKFDTFQTAVDLIDCELLKPDPVEARIAADAAFRMQHPGVFGSGSRWEQEDRECEMTRRFLNGEGPSRITIPIRAAAAQREAIRSGRDPYEVRNTLLWDTGSIGSAVPTLFASTLYEVLEAEIALMAMPTTKIPTPTGAPMSFPKLTTHSIGTQIIAQGTAIGGTDPAFNKLTLDAYKYGQLVQVSSEAITDTSIDLASFIGRDIGRALGRVVDTDLVLGTGTGEPLGVTAAITGSGTIVTGGSLINASYENLVDLVYSVNNAYRARGGAWLMRDGTAGQLRKLRDGAGGTIGAVLWDPSLTGGIQGGQPGNLLGFPAYTDPNVAAQGSAAKSILFGDFSSYYIRHTDVVIERDDSFAFDKDLVTFRAKWRVDGDLVDTSAINLLTNRVT